MDKPLLNGSGIVPIVGQLKAAGMAQHARVEGRVYLAAPSRGFRNTCPPIAAVLTYAPAQAGAGPSAPWK